MVAEGALVGERFGHEVGQTKRIVAAAARMQVGRIPLGNRAIDVEIGCGMGLSLSELRAGLPEGGLFGGGTWRWSPEPLKISSREARLMMSLGHPLARFQQACDVLYRRSASGKLPGWLAELLDEGKPEWLAKWQRDPSTAAQFPRVIRPDLILTDGDSP